MKIKLNRAEKLTLLQALQNGELDTDNIPALKIELDKAKPARVLTQKEAKEFLQEIERSC